MTLSTRVKDLTEIAVASCRDADITVNSFNIVEALYNLGYICDKEDAQPREVQATAKPVGTRYVYWMVFYAYREYVDSGDQVIAGESSGVSKPLLPDDVHDFLSEVIARGMSKVEGYTGAIPALLVFTPLR